MEKNIIEKYELVNGHAIVDVGFNLITANEEMYRFIGISTSCSMAEIIHQVDIDDFMDVANHLKEGQGKDMVLRMRRSDNSYRWMLIHIARFRCGNNDSVLNYFEFNASDIITLKKQNTVLQNNLLTFRHILAMENELFYIYDCQSGIIQISNFIDNEIHNIIEMYIDELKAKVEEQQWVSEDTMAEFVAFCQDIEDGKVSYSHIFKTNFITGQAEYDMVEFKGSTIYDKTAPSKAVGSVRNLTDASNYSSLRTYEYSNSNRLSSFDEINHFCENNIRYNENGEFALILMEIDNWDKYIEEDGQEYASRIYDIALQTIHQMLNYRGTLCEVKKNLLCIAIKDINNEVYLRAFIESLRTRIKWNVRLVNLKSNITFSMGVARYPENGRNIELINKKLNRAMDIAHQKGQNRYIIYKEHLHGDVEL